MVSIIICSRTLTISSDLSENILNTIGCDYELVVIDNSQNKYSVFEAYNLGIKKSNGTYWCFIHDDILFCSKDWGKEILSIFEGDSKIGLIGIAGAKVKTKMPSAWWDCPEEEKVLHIKQHLREGRIEHWDLGWAGQKRQEVAVIDGVFMAGRRLKEIQFDEKNLKGFHNYDMNLSLAYLKQNYKIIVTRTILLEHFSIGLIDEKWLRSTINFDYYYSKFLSLKRNTNISQKQLEQLEFKNGSRFCEQLIVYNLKIDAVKIWWRLIKQKPISKFHIIFFKKILQ